MAARTPRAGKSAAPVPPSRQPMTYDLGVMPASQPSVAAPAVAAPSPAPTPVLPADPGAPTNYGAAAQAIIPKIAPTIAQMRGPIGNMIAARTPGSPPLSGVGGGEFAQRLRTGLDEMYHRLTGTLPKPPTT